MGQSSPENDGDAPLVRRVLGGDTAAFAALVSRYRDRLGRYALHLLGNPADAEEALQDAFVRAYRSLHRCDDPARFGAWLFQILVNRCRTLGAQRTRRERTFVQDESALLGAGVAHPEDQAAWGQAIRWALDQLSVEHREAFLLKHVEERSYEEMAELTGAGVSALKMRVKRACEQLRTILQEVHRA